MNTRDKPWTGDDIASLRQLWAEGLSGSEIARRIGRGRGSVIGKAHRLGLSARPSPIVCKQAPPEPKAAPQPKPKAAPRSRVRVSTYSPAITHRKWTNADISLLRQLWAEGISIHEIAEKTGRTYMAIVGAAHRYELPLHQYTGRALLSRPKKPALPTAPSEPWDVTHARLVAESQARRAAEIAADRAAAEAIRARSARVCGVSHA